MGTVPSERSERVDCPFFHLTLYIGLLHNQPMQTRSGEKEKSFLQTNPPSKSIKYVLLIRQKVVVKFAGRENEFESFRS